MNASSWWQRYKFCLCIWERNDLSMGYYKKKNPCCYFVIDSLSKKLLFLLLARMTEHNTNNALLHCWWDSHLKMSFERCQTNLLFEFFFLFWWLQVAEHFSWGNVTGLCCDTESCSELFFWCISRCLNPVLTCHHLRVNSMVKKFFMWY